MRGTPAQPERASPRLSSRLARRLPSLAALARGAPSPPALSRGGRGGRIRPRGRVCPRRPRCGRRPMGGVRGEAPHRKETPRAGGWARAARSACSSGMGVWGAQPPTKGTRLPSNRSLPLGASGAPSLAALARGTPSPPPSPARGEGAGSALGSWVRRHWLRRGRRPMGGVGGEAPHRKETPSQGVSGGSIIQRATRGSPSVRAQSSESGSAASRRSEPRTWRRSQRTSHMFVPAPSSSAWWASR